MCTLTTRIFEIRVVLLFGSGEGGAAIGLSEKNRIFFGEEWSLLGIKNGPQMIPIFQRHAAVGTFWGPSGDQSDPHVVVCSGKVKVDTEGYKTGQVEVQR